MASLAGLGNAGVLESELSRLRAENHTLSEELSQCQADKEFVWSLWKRLQVASPDITQAIGMVVQREKEKTELKDRKVLEILQHKDDKIHELENIISSHTGGVKDLTAKKVEYQARSEKLQLDNENLKSRNHALEEKVIELQSREEHLAGRQAIKDLDREILDLKHQLGQRDRELDDLRRDKQDFSSLRDSHKERIQNLEVDLKTVGTSLSDMAKQYDEARAEVARYEQQLQQLETQMRDKDQEVIAVRNELTSLWNTNTDATKHVSEQASVINRLKQLQHDTQRMVNNQSETHSLETASLHSKYQDSSTAVLGLKQKLTKAKKRASERDQLITDLQRQIEDGSVISNSSQSLLDKETQAVEHDTEVESKLHGLEQQLEDLRRQFQKPKQRSQCDRGVSPIRPFSPSHHHSSSPHHPPERSKSASPTRRGRGRGRNVENESDLLPARDHSPPTKEQSAFRETDVKVLQKKLCNTETRLEDTKTILHIKTDELEELRRAHNKRLERLRALQANYRLVRKQLKITEEQYHGPKSKKKRIVRPSPKQLQKEDCDAVWNELSFFKNENRNLQVESLNLQEELDSLRVKVAQDAATIHELRSCLQQEKEELAFLLEQQEESARRPRSPGTEVIQQIDHLNLQLSDVTHQMESLQKANKHLSAEQQRLEEERRAARQEANDLQQKDAASRIQMADLMQERARYERELRRRRGKKSRGANRSGPRQYQRILNHSIHEMKQVFNNFGEDGWEEISDTDEPNNSGTTVTSDSLGAAIAHQARNVQPTLTSTPSPGKRTVTHLQPSQRTVESIDDHVRRMAKQDESPTREGGNLKHSSDDTVSDNTISEVSVSYRDAALSPIHFLSSAGANQAKPHVVSRKVHAASPAPRQVSALKQRVTALQSQVSILKASRDVAQRAATNHKSHLDQAQADLTLTTQRLTNTRLAAQRLTGDVERLRHEKETAERQLEEYSFNSQTSHSQQEWAALNSRLRTSSNEVSRLTSQNKQLKADSTMQADKLQALQDRVSHLERDVAQKRSLVEDMRLKLKIAHENAQCDADVMLEVEDKLKHMADTNSRYKTQVESLRVRLGAVSKEKYENEEKVMKLMDEVERKTKQAAELQKKASSLQQSVAAVERTAQQQLKAVAAQSETAVDGAHRQLEYASTRLREYEKFIKVFSHALCNSVDQARGLWWQQRQRVEAATTQQQNGVNSLSHARHRAGNILNLSASDIDDLLTSTSDSQPNSKEVIERAEEAKRDKKWSKKMDKLTQSKNDFAVPLTEVLMQKVEERSKLAAKLQVS